MSVVDFRGHTFTTSAERRQSMVAVVQRFASPERSLRVLDLGCGSGSQLLDIAAAFPRAHCVGVDISTPSIEQARHLASESAIGDRLLFHASDYLQFETDPFDVILADSVLQNIPTDTSVLLRKIGRDLRPGGFLIATLPYACLYNYVLWGGRRLLRLMRGGRLEALAGKVGRALHPAWGPDLIRERIPYLYLLPARFDDDRLRRDFAEIADMEFVHAESLPHASLAQPKHHLLIFRKPPA